MQRRLFRASLPWLQHLLHARCQCRAVSTRVGYWRHDGLNGFSCFPCPEGAECKVRSSVFALEAPVRLRVRGLSGSPGRASICRADMNRVPFQGKSSLPFPSEGYWASTRSVDGRRSLFVSDPEGADAINAEPPFFFSCNEGQCKGGTSFECADGYTGALCSECQPGQFYWNSKCDTKCSEIEPQGVVTVFGMLAVILTWIIINNSAGGMYAAFPLPERCAPWFAASSFVDGARMVGCCVTCALGT